MADIGGTGVNEMRALSARLRGADPKLRAALRRRMNGAAKPLTDKVKDSIMAMESHHDGTLRREIAGTVVSRVSMAGAGVQLTISSLGARMPEGKTNLPAETDRARGWGHPVFERHAVIRHRRHWTWVRQHGKPGWFEGDRK